MKTPTSSGTMRLGGQVCKSDEELWPARLRKTEIVERHRHRYEVNNQPLAELEAKGLVVCGPSAGDEFLRMIELLNLEYPWFTGCQWLNQVCAMPTPLPS